MSSISFQSEADGEARVGGRERAHMGELCRRIFTGILDLEGKIQFANEVEEVRLARALGFDNKLHLRQHSKYLLDRSGEQLIAGKRWNMFEVQLNTVIACGSDELRLLARIHGQCEVHGYVEGEDRAWLAGLIERALEIGLMREETQGYGKGWRDVIELLRKASDAPVVMSYSVTDGFPPYHSEEDEDDKTTNAQRWAREMIALREQPGMRLQPTDWSTIHFGAMRDTAFTLLRALDEFK